MELIHPEEKEKYDKLIDILCDAGVDRWKAELALQTYALYDANRHDYESFDEAVTMCTRPHRALGNDVEVVVFDEWLRLGEESPIVSNDIKAREEQAWKKVRSRWWTAARLIQSR